MSMSADTDMAPEVEIIDLTGEPSEPDPDEGLVEDDDPEEEGDDRTRPVAFPLPDGVNYRAQLRAAIQSTPEHRLRQTLVRLIDSDAAVYSALARELLVVGTRAPEPPASTVRVLPRWETCENCGESYDVNSAAQDACVFHPGEMEAVEERFPDWDEQCHGPMDTQENQQEYPENFDWSCCEAAGDANGCVKSRHTPAVSKNKRRRLV
ncbi:unnamed protein product [Mycena citricolor]|uniref:C2H2-type domain-containing protein n=1 Tax=Mycena citricolor TaxID=2018698 RepID=A0AAD2JZ70_9AGAR|nr:unnamed protein product [Mycena citricolor]